MGEGIGKNGAVSLYSTFHIPSSFLLSTALLRTFEKLGFVNEFSVNRISQLISGPPLPRALHLTHSRTPLRPEGGIGKKEGRRKSVICDS